jgi:trimeric autotransporter adhesin
MNTKILLSTFAISTCLLVGTNVKAQTISAPTGQSITVTNPIDITVAGGSVNVPSDGSIKIAGDKILSVRGTDLIIGKGAGNPATTGTSNNYIGSYAGESNTSGYGNNAMGPYAFRGNTTGYFNTAFGGSAGYSNTTGYLNTFIGTQAGYFNTTGNQNIFIGVSAGVNSNGGQNNFIGVEAGNSNTSGAENVGIGFRAGKTNTTGTYNTFIGNYSDASVNSLTNATAIGANSVASASNTVVLGNAATTITGTGLADGNSGLRFAKLNSTNATTPTGGSRKVLSVNGSGDVILVELPATAATTSVGSNGPVAESTWKNQDGYLYNNSTNGVVINGSGLEGNALIVKGGVLSKEVNVKIDGSDSWPDYVFKPNYKRMTLEEVERFININGHLPNVPSATEMAQTGNNLGKTDIKLLEKVEELTLYLLEMKKANDAQSAEIQSLKNQMSKLKKSRK